MGLLLLSCFPRKKRRTTIPSGQKSGSFIFSRSSLRIRSRKLWKWLWRLIVFISITSTPGSVIAALASSIETLTSTFPTYSSSTEASLSRQERSTLAQLRTGHCKRLKDYMHNKMTPPRATDAICPECLVRRHTPAHLFSCDACPTDLSIRDLWINPVRVSSFLKTLPSFSFLNPPDPPPPPPPPPPDPPP